MFGEHHIERLIETISCQTRAIDELRQELKAGVEWFKSHANLATKHDLIKVKEEIMAKIDDLIAAATALSTASDAVSVKLDNLIAKVDAFIAAVPSSDLSPAGEAALAALQEARTTAGAAGDKVDAEVTKLDGVLPTPAPPAPPTP